MDEILNSALQATFETESIEFKAEFNLESNKDWCEIVKDIVAIANTNGGIIVFGLDSKGVPLDTNLALFSKLDPAHVTDKINKYTGIQFSEFSLVQCEKEGKKLVAIIISSLSIPIIFIKPGTYDIGNGRQETAFSKGTLFFRHGAKSEQGNNEDLQKKIENRVEIYRNEWLRKVKQVVEAPLSTVFVSIDSDDLNTKLKTNTNPTMRFIESSDGMPIYLTEEDIYKRYPLDFTNLVALLKRRYSNFVCNKEFHRIRRNLESNPQFCKIRYLNPHNPNGGQKKFYNPTITNEFDKVYSQT